MLFYTHLLSGVIFFLFFNRFFHGGSEVGFFLLLLLGSILPDIDEAHSKINQWSGALGKFITFFVEHRGIFHSFILAFGLFIAVNLLWSNYYAFALFLGYVAHLTGDALTPLGVQPFYPFSEFRMSGPIKTGSWMEMLFALGLILVIAKFFF